MSPIPKSKNILNNNNFQNNIFKTSTPINDNQIPFPQRLRDTQKRYSLRQLPNYFIIQLIRFSYNPYTKQTNKIHSPVSIPLSNLNLTKIIFNTITNRKNLTKKNAIYKYDLYELYYHLKKNNANYNHYINYYLHNDNK